MPLQGFARACFAEERKTLIEAFYLLLGFQEMLLKQLSQPIEPRGLGHLWKRLGELFLGMQDVPQLVDQKLGQPLRCKGRGALRLDRLSAIHAGIGL